MVRQFGSWALILLVLAGVLAWQSAVPRAAEQRAKGEEPKARPRTENPAVAIARKLKQTADFPGFDDPKLTLEEALDQLTKLYDVSFEINDRAFKSEQIQDVSKTEIATTPIPAMKKAPLERVLRRLLKRIPGESVACWVVRKSDLEITTEAARLAEFWPNGNENVKPDPNPLQDPEQSKARPLPLVVIEFDRTPLDEALRELADNANYNVVLDARVANQIKLLVTVSLINVPLDTAVRMVADMADLRPVLLNNAIYVTTENRAERFQPGTPFPMPATPGAGAQAGLGGLGALGALGGGLGIGGGGALGFGGLQGGFGQMSPLAQPARVRIENKPLTAALRQLTEDRPVQVVVDRERIGERGNRVVTAELDHASLQNSIRLLADMADLEAVFLDNVAYVTTRENAHKFSREQPAKMAGKKEKPPTGGVP